MMSIHDALQAWQEGKISVALASELTGAADTDELAEMARRCGVESSPGAEQAEGGSGVVMELNHAQREQLETLMAEVFRNAARELKDLFEVTRQVAGDAPDIRIVLKANVDGARNAETRRQMQVIADRYDIALNRMIDCAGSIGKLVVDFTSAGYGARLTRLLAVGQEGTDRRRIDHRLALGYQMRDTLPVRHLQWARFLIAMAGLVNGFAQAHEVLLPRLTAMDRLKSLIKPAAGEAIGTQVPLLGFLVAFAESQQPQLLRLLEQMSTATGTMDQLNTFGDVVEAQIDLAGSTSAAIDEAAKSERDFVALLEEAEATL